MSSLLKIKKNCSLLGLRESLKTITFLKKGFILSLIFAAFLSSFLLFESVKKAKAALENNKANQEIKMDLENNMMIIVDGNSLLATCEHLTHQPKAQKKIIMIITGYSSTVWETDDDPFITASGKLVKKGIVANNYLPFGTKIRIPDLFGEEIFVVEDRMNITKGNYYLDIWFPSYQEALNFGVKIAEVEILQ